MRFLRKYLSWSVAVIATLIALWLAYVDIRQQEQLDARYRPEAASNTYKENLFERDIVERSVKLARLNRRPISDKDYYSDVWPSVVDFPNETCVGLRDMGIGGSFTHCFDDRTEKLTRAYSFPHEGPPLTLTYDHVDPRLVNARTDTSYFLPDGRSPWPLPRAIVPKQASASETSGDDRGR